MASNEFRVEFCQLGVGDKFKSPKHNNKIFVKIVENNGVNAVEYSENLMRTIKSSFRPNYIVLCREDMILDKDLVKRLQMPPQFKPLPIKEQVAKPKVEIPQIKDAEPKKKKQYGILPEIQFEQVDIEDVVAKIKGKEISEQDQNLIDAINETPSGKAIKIRLVVGNNPPSVEANRWKSRIKLWKTKNLIKRLKLQMILTQDNCLAIIPEDSE